MKLKRTIENMTLRDAWWCFRVLARLEYRDGIPTELWQWQELAGRLAQQTSLAPAYLRKAGKLLDNEGRRRKLRLLAGCL